MIFVTLANTLDAHINWTLWAITAICFTKVHSSNPYLRILPSANYPIRANISVIKPALLMLLAAVTDFMLVCG